MMRYDSQTYGNQMAEFYDAWYPPIDAEPAVECLARLAGTGRVLELGIGTGRIALPLVRRGVDVRGIDASQKMVSKLREKPDGDALPVTIGDFADVEVDDHFLQQRPGYSGSGPQVRFRALLLLKNR